MKTRRERLAGAEVAVARRTRAAAPFVEIRPPAVQAMIDAWALLQRVFPGEAHSCAAAAWYYTAPEAESGCRYMLHFFKLVADHDDPDDEAPAEPPRELCEACGALAGRVHQEWLETGMPQPDPNFDWAVIRDGIAAALRQGGRCC